MIQSLSNAKNLQESDSALMMSFAAGDSEGFELLYRRHSVSIYRFFYFGTHADESLAAELFYDVWMTVVRGRMRYTNDINFTDWLYHSAWARLHDHLRLHTLERDIESVRPSAKGTTVVSMADFVADNGKAKPTEPEADVLNTTSVQVTEDESLIEVIKNLIPDHKEVVLLRYCFSMSNQDIADFIDVSKSSVDRIAREVAVLLRQKVAASQSESDQSNG